MSFRRVILSLLLAIVWSAAVPAALGQEPAEPGRSGPREPPEPADMIVTGQRLSDLLLEIQRAEEAVFARFNELNSTDEFDIQCRHEKVYGVRQRFCMSNSWRKQNGNMARALVRAMRGQGNGSESSLYREEQLRKERLLNEEMRQLATEDVQLRDALENLSLAQANLTARMGTKTLSREVTALSGTLPYGAQSMFEVIMGNNPWTHRLVHRAFTFAEVYGEIRKVQVECAEGIRRLDYEAGVDWTVPSGWSGCILKVSARKATTFKLYEF